MYKRQDEYKEKIDKLVDAKIAVFHGFQEDPRPYYAMADCVVLQSYHEGMSTVLLEAAATGRPVITSNKMCIRDRCMWILGCLWRRN